MTPPMHLLGVVGLPLLAGVVIATAGPWWHHRFGAVRTVAMAARLAIGSTLLAALQMLMAVRSLQAHPTGARVDAWPWIRVGYTTVMDFSLELSGLAMVGAGVVLLTTLMLQLVALTRSEDGARWLARSALGLAGILLVVVSGNVWLAVIGWQLAVIAATDDSEAPEDPTASRWFGRVRWTDAGAWLAAVAILLGAGGGEWLLLARSGLFVSQSSLLTHGLGGPFAAVPPAAVAVVGLTVAVLGRLRDSSRGQFIALPGLVMATAAGGLLLLRMHMVLALVPTVMAAMALAGAILAAVAGLAGALARQPATALTRVTQAHFGLVLVGLGFGAWVPVCGLLLAHVLASTAVVTSREGGRMTRGMGALAGLALVGALPGGPLVWLGELAGASTFYVTAWAPGLHWVAGALVGLAVFGVAATVGLVLRGAFESPAPAPDTAPGGHLAKAVATVVLATAAVVIALIDPPGGASVLRHALTSEFAPSWLLPGDYALGPSPGVTVQAVRWGAAPVFAVAVLGLLAGPLLARARTWVTARPPRQRQGAPVATTLVEGAYNLGERGMAPWLLPGPRLVRAAGPRAAHAVLVPGLIGILAVLGVVYCNPKVVTWGPSSTYPVDLGGLNPAMSGIPRGRPLAGPAPEVPRRDREKMLQQQQEQQGIGPAPAWDVEEDAP